ncbi:I78 family peptidase inhibitor [Oceaniglobus indicus]|uniref:I78 family peptidase inhibitor n=1 Tax=Oceaniglobus indicus TaxID=2047749 RepID=UPI000C19F025|nr:I78 family peptidase inhibitor [Oceaniglobus indicus]
MQPLIKFSALGALFAAVTACVPAESTPPQPDTCGAEAYGHLVGSDIAGVSLPSGPDIRILGPDSAMTLDYIETRTNFTLDDKGRITRIFCG